MLLHSDSAAKTCSCVPQLAKQMAKQTAQRQGEQLFEAVRTAEQALQANGNVQLLLAALCGEWIRV